MDKVVHVAPDGASARFVRDHLERQGIKARVRASALAVLRTEGTVAVEVLREEDVDAARAALAYLEGTSEPWNCFRCGGENPGNFEVCWRCGGPATASDPGGSPSPYRGPRPEPESDAILPASAPQPPRSASARRADLCWALGAGVLPVCLTDIVFTRHHGVLAGLSLTGRVGLLNFVLGLELFGCLSILRRRGVNLGKLWGGWRTGLLDLPAGALLAGLLFLVYWVVRIPMYQLGLSSVLAMTPALTGTAVPVTDADMVALVVGVAFAAGTGTLLIYGIVLDRFRAATHSRIAAVAISGALATLMWQPTSGLGAAAAAFAQQLLLGGCFLIARRVWPLALGSAICAILLNLVLQR